MRAYIVISKHRVMGHKTGEIFRRRIESSQEQRLLRGGFLRRIKTGGSEEKLERTRPSKQLGPASKPDQTKEE